MKKTIIALMIIVAMCLVVPAANAFDVLFINNTDKALLFELFWLECDWEGYSTTKSVMMGELKAGKTSQANIDFKAGPYVIIWYNLSGADEKFHKEYPFEVKEPKNSSEDGLEVPFIVVTSTPNEEPTMATGI